ncbi:MAG: class I mannose-6-phosphate isomerase [Oscillospiraceae bacterium]|jgi:mannose-6-phosphate isomerase class I|nr:class I mannose-6-phosphate isomerase [Oscillospiraceae bacterium]
MPGRIMKLIPAIKDYLWGGDRLKTQLNQPGEASPMAESWVLSCHPDGESLIKEGDYAGQSLAACLNRNPSWAFKSHCYIKHFPVLVKLIDAKQKLSVQVHPNNAYALLHEISYGKTELWYIIDSDPGAFLYYGFKRKSSREEVERRAADGSLEEILNAVPVRAGDVFFIEPGTVHAIGAGILLAEVQQNSNITYRLYDYKRKSADGKPRELHIKKALDVAELSPPRREYGAPREIKRADGALITPLGACEWFETAVIKTADVFENSAAKSSFHSLVCLDGAGTLSGGGQAVTLEKGESVFIPAGFGEYKIDGSVKILFTRWPQALSGRKRRVL